MKKILVRVPQWLGDAVVSTIFLTRLKAKFPQAEINVLAPASLRDLFKSHPSVHNVLILPSSQGGSVWGAGRLLKPFGYDAVYILPRSFRSALESWLARIPRRIGYAGDGRGLLLTEAIPYNDQALYPHRYLKLIGEENFPVSQMNPYFPTENVGDLKGYKKPFLGIGPASVAPARTWDADRFVEIGRRFIQEKKGTVFLFGSPKEAALTSSLAHEIGDGVVDKGGQLNLPTLGGFMSKMDGYLGNDSGLMHVASAFKVPSVVLFGPSDPTWALPPFGRAIPLQDRSISCVPCLRNECVRLGESYRVCQKSLTPTLVWTALEEIF